MEMHELSLKDIKVDPLANELATSEETQPYLDCLKKTYSNNAGDSKLHWRSYETSRWKSGTRGEYFPPFERLIKWSWAAAHPRRRNESLQHGSEPGGGASLISANLRITSSLCVIRPESRICSATKLFGSRFWGAPEISPSSHNASSST